MKALTLILGATLLLTNCLIAQQAVLSGGESTAGNGLVMDHAVGEVFTPTLSGDGMVTQGVIQPQSGVSFEEDFEALLYPNPFQDQLTLVTNNWEAFEQILLYAVDGSLVYIQDRTDGPVQVISPRNLARGMYQLVLLDSEGKVFVGKVIKG